MERENLAGDGKGKGASGSNREAESTDAPERGGLPCGIPVKSVGPLASLSSKQCDGLSVAEVLKRDIQ
jgi:hypothetical protein